MNTGPEITTITAYCMLALKWPSIEEKWFSCVAAVHIPIVNTLCIYPNAKGLYHTFSDSASSRVARAVSVLLESVCRDLTRSFRFPSCLSLSRSCSCRFSIWHREEETGRMVGGTGKKKNSRETEVNSGSNSWTWRLQKSLKINTLCRQCHVHSLKCARALQRSIFHFRRKYIKNWQTFQTSLLSRIKSRTEYKSSCHRWANRN